MAESRSRADLIDSSQIDRVVGYLEANHLDECRGMDVDEAVIHLLAGYHERLTAADLRAENGERDRDYWKARALGAEREAVDAAADLTQDRDYWRGRALESEQALKEFRERSERGAWQAAGAGLAERVARLEAEVAALRPGQTGLPTLEELERQILEGVRGFQSAVAPGGLPPADPAEPPPLTDADLEAHAAIRAARKDPTLAPGVRRKVGQ